MQHISKAIPVSHGPNTENLTRERLANMLGVKDKAALCPVVLQNPLCPALDVKHTSHSFLINAFRDQAKTIINSLGRGEFEEPSRPRYISTETAIRDYVAGLQFAYEQAPWADNKLEVEMAAKSEGYISSLKNITMDGNNLLLLRINAELIAYCTAKHKNSGNILKEQAGEAYSSDRQAFLQGIVLGRSISQNLNAELSRFVKSTPTKREGKPLSDQEANDLNRQTLEADITQFMQEHKDSIDSRFELVANGVRR
jgi:hypothetical protein